MVICTAFNEYSVAVSSQREPFLFSLFITSKGLVHGFEEPVKLDGFQQIVHRVIIVTIQRIFRVSCRKYDKRVILKSIQELNPAEIRHVDVQKE